MPEGHTIHRLARDQLALVGGKRLSVTSPQGRFDANPFDGRVLTTIEPYGKHLVYVFSGKAPTMVHVHLGLFGKFFVDKPVRPTTRMRLATDDVTIDLSGPTACEAFDKSDLRELLARLGPDPLRDDADLESAAAYLAKSRAPIGAALLDQSVVAGIGNVYRAEILFLHGIDPKRPSSSISVAEHRKLLATARRLLKKGVELGRIVTVSGATKKTPRREAVHVYKRKTCPTCGETIASSTVGGRAIYSCPECQR